MPWSTIMRNSSSDIVSSGARFRPKASMTMSAHQLMELTKGDDKPATSDIGRAKAAASFSDSIKARRFGTISAKMTVKAPIIKETTPSEMIVECSTSMAHLESLRNGTSFLAKGGPP